MDVLHIKVVWILTGKARYMNLRDNLICIMKCEIRSKSVVAVGKEDKKRKVFLHFYAS